MLTALANAFKIPDLRRKILFTLMILGLYRVGAHVPAPGIDIEKVQAAVQESAALGLLNLFSGGALENVAVFALGIMPYITSSIIMQLLQGVIPKLEQWAKEGETGQRKITQLTRYMTLGIGLMQSIALIAFFRDALRFTPADGAAYTVTFAVIIITMLAGVALIMWMGELITQRGIGNGMSLIIFASIVARFPSAIIGSLQIASPLLVLLLVPVFLFIVVSIVTMERGQRRIPVQYAKRVVGRRVYGGTGTYIPLKVNGANVIPIIFASAILFFPAQIAQMTGVAALERVATSLTAGWPYFVFQAALIIFFTYFYTALVFNPIDLADNLRKNGGFIPGVRPGKATVTYIENVINRITLPGAIFLAAIAVAPTLLFRLTNVPGLQEFGGTSILIMVGVSLETMRQLESQLQMRHYEGFFK
ncbi:MAG: preprotein translocase subunit SecY [Coriobacteriia bacterium]|nr:preprotein translocase subunit SecY [Coriobacteriia bacterium]